MSTDEDSMLSVTEVAKTFGVKGFTVREWIKMKKIEATRTPGGQWRVRKSEVKRFAENQFGVQK